MLRHVLKSRGEFLPGLRAATGNLGDSLRAVQRNGADQLLPVRRAHRVQGQQSQQRPARLVVTQRRIVAQALQNHGGQACGHGALPPAVVLTQWLGSGRPAAARRGPGRPGSAPVPVSRRDRVEAVPHPFAHIPGGTRRDAGPRGDLTDRRLRILRDELAGHPAARGRADRPDPAVAADPVRQVRNFRTCPAPDRRHRLVRESRGAGDGPV